MRIARARLLRYAIPFTGPFSTAKGLASVREGYVLRFETDTGLAGLGEASLLPNEAWDERFGELVERNVRTALGEQVEDLAGDLARERGASGHEAAARAAVSIASWDLLARSRDVSLARLLSDAPRPAVAVNALIGALSEADIEGASLRARGEGFQTVKLKVGVAPTIEEERRRVSAARRALGSAIKLRIDANGAWTEAQAIVTLQALEEYDLEFVEQPVPAGNLESLKRVREAVSTPIAADEDVTGVDAALRILDLGAADILVLKPLQLGGIGAARAIAAAARRAGAQVVVTTTIDTGVATAAALHLAASLPVGPASGLATASLLAAGLVRPHLAVERGCMALPASPGLGVALDEAQIRAFIVQAWDIET